MALANYAELKTEVEEWLDRDDLTDKVDSFIRLAEARHTREVRIREMLVRVPLTVINRYTNLPTGYLEAKTFRLLTDPLTVLKSLNLHEMNNRRSESTGKPLFFTVHAQIEFDRVSDAVYNGEMIYYQQQTPLSTTNTTNSLLTKAPDIYLWSALSASAPFLMNDERINTWETLYRNAVESLGVQDSKPIGPIASQVSGTTP